DALIDHAEKEGLIFPSVQVLSPGEVLKIIVEFNPVPLLYLLRAQGEFEVHYEKEGPDEWILNVTRVTPKENAKGQFKELLQELKTGEVSSQAKEKAKELLQAVDATSLGIIEQELIREGISHDEIRRSLCDIHLEVLKDSLVAKRIEVSSPHPIHTFMEEHKHILQSLADLRSVVENLKQINSLDALGPDREKLEDAAHHLIEAEAHHRREEEALFPRLEKRDIVEPPQIMRLDHGEFRGRKEELYQLTHNSYDGDFQGFKTRVTELGGYLAEQVESHIFKEDNILYQIALQVLSPEEWDEVKGECDAIGYCCFTPQG
ncbi:MAG: DUF438 domain-containing protein, partial [Chloroflexi bacterium]|nr:DUF438 domain-containing protein [Chloroflexota bacterium]